MNVATNAFAEKRMADDPSLFHVICLLSPPRKGVRLFIAKLEHEHYHPGFGMSGLEVRYMKWEGLEFAVVSVPIHDRPLLHRVAEEVKLYLHDGIPTVVDAKGERWFPISSPRVYTLRGYSATMSPKQRASEEAEILRLRRRTWSVMGDSEPKGIQ